MSAPPGWVCAWLRALAPQGEADDVLGDLEETHRARTLRHRKAVATILTALEGIEIATALVRARFIRFWFNGGSSMVQDYKLGFRMLVKYPGLTIVGGAALAIAVGVGAGWYDVMHDVLRPAIPLPGGDRLVEIEMRDSVASGRERRLLHDVAGWQRDVHTVEDLGAYRSLQRNLVLGDGRVQPVTVAETTAAAFRAAPVPPLLGRALVDSDEQSGAAPVAVLGYSVWQTWFGGRRDVIGRTLQLGHDTLTVVGVMPRNFAFPVNHRLWVPLRLKAGGYAPLDGPEVRVFGRIAPGATQAQANAEFSALVEREAAASPSIYAHLRPRVLAYGGQSPGDRGMFEIALTQLPIVLVLLVACANVATLIFARTATRDAEIATRTALGASRGRIVFQLFSEALVLASLAALVGLVAADAAVQYGVTAFYAGQPGGAPFWIDPGLEMPTVLYGLALTIVIAAMLGVLPALKATGTKVHLHLKNVGAGGSTLKFGGLWTSAIVLQVALTVMCLPPAVGITEESVRDVLIRGRFPTGEYLAVQAGVDDGRMEAVVAELQRRLSAEPGVIAVTYGDRLPGMTVDVRHGELEATPGAAAIEVPNLWTAAVGPGYFEAFDRPITAGRDFYESDRAHGTNAVIVNEAFARQYLGGASPVGHRVRFASVNADVKEPWYDIVGMVRDIGMTPTDEGEAPYAFRPASLSNAHPLVLGVRVRGSGESFAPRLREIAAAIDPALRLDDVQPLDRLAWRVDTPQMIAAGSLAFVVALGLFLSAAAVFSLMSVTVARRTREIGLRAALGAGPGRLLRGVFARAMTLVGAGILAGDVVIALAVVFGTDLDVTGVLDALAFTSGLMLIATAAACVQPARRALRIEPAHALRDA
jgi:predicted permease